MVQVQAGYGYISPCFGQGRQVGRLMGAKAVLSMLQSQSNSPCCIFVIRQP